MSFDFLQGFHAPEIQNFSGNTADLNRVPNLFPFAPKLILVKTPYLIRNISAYVLFLLYLKGYLQLWNIGCRKLLW